jgi:AhpD family alkylhydroperoxidase
MNSYRRRIYPGFGELLYDLRMIFSRPKEIYFLMQGKVIPPSFRERLMLTVTAVNRCRYCSHAHSRVALSEGITRKEIEELGKGELEGSPSEEAPALLYARHWAETNGEPEEALRDQMVERYGKQAAEGIELALRLIRVSNLSGNAFDYLLYKGSFGRWGG